MEVRQTFVILIVFWVNINTYLSDERCGHPLGSLETARIVGGFDVGYFKYPWFAALMNVREEIPYCGGTLVSSKHVVTAAHCFKSYLSAASHGQAKLEDVFTVTLGAYNICKSEPTQKSFKVRKVYVHERYYKQQPYYDIALLTLAQEARGFEPCCLPRTELTTKTRPREAFIQGLGDQSFEAKKQTCTLHEARVLIYPDDACRKMLDSVDNDGKALIHAFCAGYLQGGIDACQALDSQWRLLRSNADYQTVSEDVEFWNSVSKITLDDGSFVFPGDSGGPLLILGPNSQYILQGITSFGFDCAKPDVLGLYTDPSHYLPWLDEKMGRRRNDSNIIGQPVTNPNNFTQGTVNGSTEKPGGVNETDEPQDTQEPGSGTEVTPAISEKPVGPPQGTTVNWSVYPATPWIPVTITPVPVQTMPPTHKHKKHKKHYQIVINIGRHKHHKLRNSNASKHHRDRDSSHHKDRSSSRSKHQHKTYNSAQNETAHHSNKNTKRSDKHERSFYRNVHARCEDDKQN